MGLTRKICVLGDFGVGKTSLTRRYVLNEFSDIYRATLGVNIYKFTDKISDDTRDDFTFVIWDVEGASKPEPRTDTYIQGAAGALIVGDITRPDMEGAMIANAQRFYDLRAGRPMAFAVNKSDLLGDRLVPSTDRLTSMFSGPIRQTSAKTGSAVPELFRQLATRIIEIGV